MISSKEKLIEYILERVAHLEIQYEEARKHSREPIIVMIHGQVMELSMLYYKLTGSTELEGRLYRIFTRNPIKHSP